MISLAASNSLNTLHLILRLTPQRTVLWSFAAKTSRTQPKAAQWIFSPAVWLRFLIKPEPGMALAYIDYSSAEFMIGASMSDGHCGPINNMMDLYRSGDPYLNFAKRVGAIPKEGTKQTHGEVRDKYKTFLLASQYGMSSKTLSARLGNSDLEAHEMITQHHEVFAQYWQWSDARRDGSDARRSIRRLRPQQRW